MAIGFAGFVAPTSGSDGGFVASVKQVEDAVDPGEIAAAGAIDEEEVAGAVGDVAGMGEPYGLQVRLPCGRGAVGQPIRIGASHRRGGEHERFLRWPWRYFCYRPQHGQQLDI